MDASEPRLLRTRIDAGVTLAAFEWHPELRGRGPTLVFTHATGFHARCWDEVIRRLGARHVIAVDQRGHGRSDKNPFESWQTFGLDLLALLTALDVDHAVGIGHSMGGHATVLAAAAEPVLFDRLVLIDPVIMAPHYYRDHDPIPGKRGAGEHPTIRRRNRFASVEAMIERFADRTPYSLFTRRALRDYCRYGLLPAPDGDGLVLACPPQFEASVYVSARSNPGIYESVRRVTAPVTLIRAMQPRSAADLADFAYSPTYPQLAGEFRSAVDHYLPERTHFLPMQDPDKTVELIAA